MSRHVFRLACKIAEDRGETISIGGGEPTLHPLFWDFLGIAIRATSSDEGMLWMATNGKRTEDALILANLARNGVLGVALSLDTYHEPIEARVERAFGKGEKKSGTYGRYLHGNSRDFREIRDVTANVARSGRAKDWGDTDYCPCPDLFVAPNGYIYQCGCQTKQLGTVWKPKIPDGCIDHCVMDKVEVDSAEA